MCIKTKLANSIIASANVNISWSKDEILSSLSDKADYVGSAISSGAGRIADAGKATVNKITEYAGDPEVSRDVAYRRAAAEDAANTAMSAPGLAKDIAVIGSKDVPSARDAIRLLSDVYSATEYPAKAMMHPIDPHPLTGYKTPTLSRATSGGRYDRRPIDKALEGNYYDAGDDAVYNIKDYLKGYMGRNIMGVGLIDAGLDKGSDHVGANILGGAGLIAANNAIPAAGLLASIYGYKGLRRLLRKG